MADVISLLPLSGGKIRIDGEEIASIVQAATKCDDRLAAMAALRIVRYLIEVIAVNNKEKR